MKTVKINTDRILKDIGIMADQARRWIGTRWDDDENFGLTLMHNAQEQIYFVRNYIDRDLGNLMEKRFRERFNQE